MQPYQKYQHIVTGSIIYVDSIAEFRGTIWVYYTKLTNNELLKNKYMRPLYSAAVMYKPI